MTRHRSAHRIRSRTVIAPRVNPDLLRRLAHHLTPRDRAVLELVWEHRVLTTHQLGAIFFNRPRAARARLLVLNRLAALERFQPWTPNGTEPCHWVLGPAGAHVVAGQRGIDVTDLGYRRTATLAIAHSTKLRHQVGVNEFFAQLHAYARRHGDGASVAQWWSERRCAALWGDLARPDAYGRWVQPVTGHPQAGGTAGPVAFDFFLEYDTGSETLRRLADKVAGYTALAEATGITTPVLFWLPGQAREVNVRKLLGEPAAPVATAVHTISTDPKGPVGAIWLPAGTIGPRLSLVELAERWPVSTGEPAGPQLHDQRQPPGARDDDGQKQRPHPHGRQDRTGTIGRAVGNQ